MSARTRVDVGCMAFSLARLDRRIENVLRLFREAWDEGLVSGPLSNITFYLHRHADDREILRCPEDAFTKVFADRFGSEYVFYDQGSAFGLGKARIHQPLGQCLHGTGPFNSVTRHRFEKLQKVVQKEEGTFEDMTFCTSVGREHVVQAPTRVFYVSDAPKPEAEQMVRDKCQMNAVFVAKEDVQNRSERLITIEEYVAASRAFGPLWTLVNGLVRAVPRDHVPLLELFVDHSEAGELASKTPEFSEGELLGALAQSPRLKKTYVGSPSYLKAAVKSLTHAELVGEQRQKFHLTPYFHGAKHATYYTLGEFSRLEIV
ncbi:MAG: hypothetical protein H8E44_34250 [Planctomycetes bacterium]|nr:hypothetical protein [Planctomycetota bacterium]